MAFRNKIMEDDKCEAIMLQLISDLTMLKIKINEEALNNAFDTITNHKMKNNLVQVRRLRWLS